MNNYWDNTTDDLVINSWTNLLESKFLPIEIDVHTNEQVENRRQIVIRG